MAVDIKIIKNLADLAAINIEEKELISYAQELDMIIKYMGRLKNLDTGDTEPMEHILDVNNIFREDDVTNKNIKDELIKNASIAEDDYFIVPMVVELL